ncbi:FecR domain-containing protein [Spirosoma sp. BT702]|uniref:FecR domain-containing protein n=1 Tax=Spirosoma profusum TaxID=2771354 RepID=A0A927ATP4_9BACT|nr:FecR domain-containing protein [Spirosoma profusum]MBD2704055.1 FecR domain-containing protein [Spirosoma profusum]
MNESINKQRLFDYFAGKATALEKQQIDEWCRDPTNEEQFYNWLDEWEQSHLQYAANQSVKLEKYHSFLFAGQPNTNQSTVTESDKTPEPSRSFLNRLPWWSLAVAASLLITLGIFGFQEQLMNQTYTTTYGETQSLTLADGSKVVLNANSSLRVPRFGFGTHRRDVHLAGEANFSVIHTPDDQQFIVHTTKGVNVVVLGTEFTVFTRPRETKVVLAKGKVLVNYPTATQQIGQLMLKPGDLITLDGRGRLKRSTTRQPSDHAAWQRNQFVFDHTTLRDVGQLLTENYGIHVQINGDTLAHQTLTGSFHAENADELLQAISEVLGINVVRHDDQVVLTDNTF